MIIVKDIKDYMNSLAPFSLAEKWDNSGMLCGDENNRVEKIIVCLDITNEVAKEAIRKEAQVIVSHHPVIFNPLKSLDNNNPAVLLASKNISAICSHTCLDMARDGINDIIANMIDGTIIEEPFEIVNSIPFYQISVYVPKDSVEKVYKAMRDAGAGTLGDYSGCAFMTDGEGTFMPLEGSHPYIGQTGVREKVDEVKIEMILPQNKRKAVLDEMLKAHPYEMPAYNLFYNYAIMESYGYGKIIKLDREYSAYEFAEYLKKLFGNKVIRYNDTGKKIRTLAYCSGGGGSLVQEAISSGVDAYFCGDIKHDQFIDANNAGLMLFDAGHYYTENIVVDFLKNKLSQKFSDIKVEIAESNRDIVDII